MWDESVYGEFEVLLMPQQVTNLAAVIAHCCISPNGYGSLLASGMTGRKIESAAQFPVGFVCSGSTVCLLLGAGLSVVSLGGKAVFTESVPGEGFSSFWVGHGVQVFCNCVFSVKGQETWQFISQ